jgi:hypothetical protein
MDACRSTGGQSEPRLNAFEAFELWVGPVSLRRQDRRRRTNPLPSLYSRILPWTAAGKRAFRSELPAAGAGLRIPRPVRDPDSSSSFPAITRFLLQGWIGMSKDEAEGSSRQTMFCYLIGGKNQSPVAIFYLDAEPANAWGCHSDGGSHERGRQSSEGFRTGQCAGAGLGAGSDFIARENSVHLSYRSTSHRNMLTITMTIAAAVRLRSRDFF